MIDQTNMNSSAEMVVTSVKASMIEPPMVTMTTPGSRKSTGQEQSVDRHLPGGEPAELRRRVTLLRQAVDHP